MVLLCCLARQAPRGALLAGVLLCRSACQSLKGAPWSYFVVWRLRHLMGRPLLFSCWCCHMREAMVMAPPPHVTQQYHLASMAACLAFLHRPFPSQSPPSHPPDPVSPQSTAALAWGCSTIPKLQLPAAAPSSGPASLSGQCMAAARTVWFSFHLGCHRSAVSLWALNVPPLTQTIALLWGLDPCFSSSPHWGQVQSF